MNLIFCFPGYHLGTYSMHTREKFRQEKNPEVRCFLFSFVSSSAFLFSFLAENKR